MWKAGVCYEIPGAETEYCKHGGGGETVRSTLEVRRPKSRRVPTSITSGFRKVAIPQS